MNKKKALKFEPNNQSFFSEFFGIWWIRKEDGEYYIYKSLYPDEVYNNKDQLLKKRKVFGDEWQKIAAKISSQDEVYKKHLETLIEKYTKLINGEIDLITNVSPWMNEQNTIVWVEDQLTTIEKDDDGTAKIIVGCTYDLTKSIEYKESISELEQRNSLISKARERAIELAKILVWRVDYELFPQGDFYLANQLYINALGLETNESGYLAMADFVSTGYPDAEGKETMGKLMMESQKITENKSDESLYCIVKHRNLKTGKIVYLEHNTSVESRYEDGRLKALGGFVKDVTEQVQMESDNIELSKVNIRLQRAQRLAIKSGKVLVWFLDSEESDSDEYFFGNEFLIEKLGLNRYGSDKFSIKEFNQSIYDGDEEGKKLKEAYFDMDDKVEFEGLESYDKLIVKHQNLKTKELFYLEHNFEVEKRYEDNSLMIRGGFMADVTKEEEYKRRNEFLVSYDEVTRLLNRNSFEKYTNSDDLLKKYTLIVADIDGLKFINDAFGHMLGDKAIICIATKLLEYFGDDSKIFRIGGDEFAVISSNTNEKEIEEKIQKLHDGCDSFEETNKFEINVSIGFEIVDNDFEFLEAFINAENLMYRRKLNDRNSRKSKTMETVLETLNQKTEETKEHCTRMGDYAVNLMKELGYNRSSDLEDMRLLCQVHDIGKITISEDLLSKKGKLSREEFIKIKNHSEAGYKIVRNIVESDRIAYGVLYHHEKIDGTGYPFGLVGEEIPLFAKIVSICDAYDVMVTGRQYSKAKTKEEVIVELNRCSGTQFDQHIVEVFIKMISKNGE